MEDGTTGNRLDLWAATSFLSLKLTPTLTLRSEGFIGQKLGTMRAGPSTDVSNGEAIKTRGGWLELIYRWNSSTKSHLGMGTDDVELKNIAAADVTKI